MIRWEETETHFFSAVKRRGKVGVVWLLGLSDLSAFPPICDSGLLLLRLIRTCAIAVQFTICSYIP